MFVPFFFFASIHAQVSLGETASKAAVYILYFFLGFVIMAQLGGRILDRRGAWQAVVLGCALGAVGFYLLAETARNFGASLGLAVLGAILITESRPNVTNVLTNAGVPARAAHKVAASLSATTPGAQPGAHQPSALVHDLQLAFTHSTQTIFYIMAAVMAASFLVALRWLPRGKVAPHEELAGAPVPADPGR